MVRSMDRLDQVDPADRRRHRAAVVRLAVARWPSCWLAIRRRYLARVAELDREGQGFGLSPADARVDAELLAYVEVTREAVEAGIAVPALPAITLPTTLRAAA